MKFLKVLFLLFSSLSLTAQDLPPIQRFTTSDYAGDNQNWMISQGQNNYIYVANNKGLLEYNGAEWTAYPSPNNTILRAVKAVGSKIFTGCYEELGYWVRNDLGELNYTSLVPKLETASVNDDQIWNILSYDEWILFQAGHALFFYNQTTDSMKVISSKNIIYKVFCVNDQIFYHVNHEGLYVIEDGKSKLVNAEDIILNDRVINIFELDNELLVLTRNSGFFTMENGKLSKWSIAPNEALKQLNIFSSIKLKDDSFVIGSISNGIFQFDKNGTIKYEINQKIGLGNNTVLALFEDKDHNVWAGLDNGIDCINVTSPIKTFIDYDGVLGTVYTSIVYNDLLYVGTNQGLFFKPFNDNGATFKFVKGSAGQVWSLFSDKDENLLCGHHLGTFLIHDDQAQQISTNLGAWNFKTIPGREDLLLQGNYNGLYILKKTNGIWRVRNKFENFVNSSRFFEIDTLQNIWVNHEYKGMFQLEIDSSLSKVKTVTLHSELPLSKYSSLVKYRGDLLYTSKEGVYKYEASFKTFKKDSMFSSFMQPKEYTSGKMVVDASNKLWLFSKENISYIKNNDLTNTPEITNIPIPAHLRKGVLGFENINLVSKEHYILGTANGYLALDLPQVNVHENYTIHLNKVSITDFSDMVRLIPIDQFAELKPKHSTLSLSYAVPEYDQYLDVKYQYKLRGLRDQWSQWSTNNVVQFENLSFGDYQLKVRAKVGNQLTENTVIYGFTVNRPWYLSKVALLLYLFTLVFIGILVHKAYRFYYNRILSHEQVENEKTIIQIKNEKLNQDIESKNRELAISTMSIIKKNEVLNKIKKELKHNVKKEDVKSAIKLIDENLNPNKDWKFFKEAFNNADKDFLDKIKAAHTDLTPNDLKFCAYLRLNLSSKEIAPLLNISTKSVETKRYRLRKRLKLEHDDGLVNYILKF